MELVVVFCYVQIGKNRNEYTAALRRLYSAGMAAVLFDVLFMQAPTAKAALLCNCLYYIAMDWVLLFMMYFIFLYTNSRGKARLMRVFFSGITTADSVQLFVNQFTEHLFTVRQADYHGMAYWDTVFFPLHYLHMGICYSMSILVAFVLVDKIRRSPKPYRKQHITILAVFEAVLLNNALSYLDKLPIDTSLFFFILLAVAFCYFLMVSPREVVESILANVVEDIDNGIVCFDFSGKCIYVNAGAREILQNNGMDPGQVQDSFYMEWIRTHAMDSVDYEYWDKEYTVEGQSHHFQIEFQRLKDSQNATIGYFYKLTDKTKEAEDFQEGRYQAPHDRLTGLYTQDYFFQKAEEIIRRDPEKERYMVCTDIKNFRMLIEVFGEEMGDKILVAQAALLKYTNGEDCIQGRISGEKFAMLITKEHFNAEMTVRNTGRLQYRIDGKNYKLNLTMGVYHIEDPAESPREMYEKACMAAQSQENDYQKTVVYYDAKVLQQILKEQSMTEEFENGLHGRQFRMFLQPQMDSQGKVVGAEVLARWQHPKRGLIFPVDFLSVVEKSGLISRLDQYMWELAAERLRQWKEKGIENVSISVNVSAKDFYYIDIYGTLTGIAEKYGIDPAKMNLEVSEMELLSDAEPKIAELKKLQAYGFPLQIDNFGKGYSSLNSLQAIQADSLKIDMRLLEEMQDAEKQKKILNAIITMAHTLDMEVIAESVERAEQAQVLKELGCNLFQGYFFSKPLAVEDFEAKYF